MKVISKEFSLQITVDCEDEERESTKDWLTNDDYECISEWQNKSKSYWIIAEKKELIKFSDKCFKDADPVVAAKGFAELNNIQVGLYGFHAPTIESSKIDEFQYYVKFYSAQLCKYYYVYIIKQNEQYEAVAWSVNIT